MTRLPSGSLAKSRFGRPRPAAKLLMRWLREELGEAVIVGVPSVVGAGQGHFVRARL